MRVVTCLAERQHQHYEMEEKKKKKTKQDFAKV